MKPNSLLQVAITVACLLLPSLSPARSNADGVLETERRRIAALADDDFAALGAILHAELTYAHSTAQVESKEQFLDSLRSGRVKYTSLEHRDQLVRAYGDTVILTGICRVGSILQGKPAPPVDLRVTIVYVRAGARWQMVAWQSTRVP